uniref:Uncharacterized protein n=1 Tax=Salix viminalis TaxID=40686 RepID=A0A6N2L4T5_SALVM
MVEAQVYVISGTIAQWYFTKEDAKLEEKCLWSLIWHCMFIWTSYLFCSPCACRCRQCKSRECSWDGKPCLAVLCQSITVSSLTSSQSTSWQ